MDKVEWGLGIRVNGVWHYLRHPLTGDLPYRPGMTWTWVDLEDPDWTPCWDCNWPYWL